MKVRHLNGAPSGPFTGLRVLDFSSFIAGCYTAQLLGDFGADVIKIEPLAGDGARHWGPFLRGEGMFFQNWNRNKRGIALDLASSDGQEVVKRLVRDTDIVVENFRPGVTARLGIDYETLQSINPGIVHCSITAFGAKGPYANRPGYDPVLQSMSGAVLANERYCGAVGVCSVAISDYGAAMLAYGSIAAALYHRERTGEGQRIETSLLQSAMAMQSHFYCKAENAEPEPPLGIYPYRLFETSDALIFIAAPTNKFWGLLCQALGVPELASDPRFNTNAGRVTHAETLTERLSPIFKEKSTADWESLLVDKGVPCGPVCHYDEYFAHPQVKAMNMRVQVDHAGIGPLHLPGVPVHFEKTPGVVHTAAPLLGQHTDAVLREAGYGDAEIERLRLNGVTAALVIA